MSSLVAPTSPTVPDLLQGTRSLGVPKTTVLLNQESQGVLVKWGGVGLTHRLVNSSLMFGTEVDGPVTVSVGSGSLGSSVPQSLLRSCSDVITNRLKTQTGVRGFDWG